MSIEVKEKVVPKWIEAKYNAYLSWDLEAEGIDLDDVKEWYVARGQLFIKFNNGGERYIDSWSDDNVDYKHGLEEVLVFDEDWNQIEGRSDV